MCPVKRNRMLRLWRGPWRRSPWLRLPVVGFAPLLLLYLCQLITLQGAPEAAAWMTAMCRPSFLHTAFSFAPAAAPASDPEPVRGGGRSHAAPAALLHRQPSGGPGKGSPILASDLAMTGQAGQIAGFLRPGMELGAATWQGWDWPSSCSCWPSSSPGERPRPGGTLGPAAWAAPRSPSPCCATFCGCPPPAPSSRPQGGEPGGAGTSGWACSPACQRPVRESAMEAPDAYTREQPQPHPPPSWRPPRSPPVPRGYGQHHPHPVGELL